MKIAVNTIPLLSPLTGIGKYTWQLCRALQTIGADNNYSYYYGYFSSKLFCQVQANKVGGVVGIKDVIKSLPFLGHLARSLKSTGTFLSSEKYDLYFEPNYIPLRINAKKIVTTVADFSAFKHPEWHDRELVRYFNKHFWKNIKRADHIITCSDFIRDEAINEYGFPPEKVTTVYLGHDSDIFKRISAVELLSAQERLHLPNKFILCVGSVEPRKNLLRLIRAYQQLPLTLRVEYKLVLAGFRGWDNDEIMALIKDLEGDVIYTGYVSESDLAVLYNLATLFVFPSLYEGFGLPPLEAMACGCPVIVSNVASLPEVCGDATVYIDPLDTDDLASKIENVLSDAVLLKKLSCRGVAKAELFSWDKSARQHLEVFNAVMN